MGISAAERPGFLSLFSVFTYALGLKVGGMFANRSKIRYFVDYKGEIFGLQKDISRLTSLEQEWKIKVSSQRLSIAYGKV